MKFSNAKMGDRVWSIVYGWGKITKVDKSKTYGIEVSFILYDDSVMKKIYNFNGREDFNALYTSLFWNEVKLPTDEEDKQPFNLVEFLKENLEPKEFEKPTSYSNWTDNLYLVYMYSECEWKYAYERICEIPTVYFKSICNEVLEKLTINNVTPKQLKEAYKKLNWI